MMQFIFRISSGIACLLFFAISLQGQPAVQASLDTTSMLIGDRVKLKLSAIFPKGMTVSPPNLSALDTASFLEIVNPGKWDTLKNGSEVICQQSLTITVFDSGAFWIPAIPFNYQEKIGEGSVSTNKLLLNVGTIEADSSFLAPIKPIIQEPLRLEDFMPYIIGLLIILALAALIYFFYKKKKERNEPPPPEIIIPAHELALNKLSDLKNAKLWQQGEVKEYQSQLTYIVREYIENRFDIQALESTTDQIVSQLHNLNVEDIFKKQLREMLQMADLVKFAKAKPPVNVHQRLMDEAESFVVKTQKKIIVTEPEAEQSAES